eukprot:TRINITY_DN66732_c0_g1_i1.p2 TRINITY_DN66732_c0_g1~~TRINITY_DN66732_c0_g1_i1.p2  ORF type:complete len:117 (+),score=0.25 TRINITY_DN66732_c0_g1_i1:523-873(+)
MGPFGQVGPIQRLQFLGEVSLQWLSGWQWNHRPPTCTTSSLLSHHRCTASCILVITPFFCLLGLHVSSITLFLCCASEHASNPLGPKQMPSPPKGNEYHRGVFQQISVNNTAMSPE